MGFKVTNIISGNVIKVESWNWRETDGTLVEIFGYRQPTPGSSETLAKSKLEVLLLNNEVELKKARDIKDLPDGKCIVCSVFLNDIDISEYFPELKPVS